MGLFIKLGFKNISRNKMRSVLTITAVTLCAAGIFLFHVFFNGMIVMMLEGITQQRGHVRLINTKLAKNERLGKGQHFVTNLDQTIKKVTGLKGVQFVAPRLDTGGYIDHSFTPKQEQAWLKAGKCVHKKALAKDSAEVKKDKHGKLIFFKQAPAAGGGVDPAAEKKYTHIFDNMPRGRMIKPTGKEIVIGKKLAARLHACVGSKLTLIGKTVDDSMSAIAVKVVGIFSTGMGVVDKTFMINMETAQYYMDLPNGAGVLKIFGDSMDTAPALKKSIVALKLPGLTAQTWKEDNYMGQTLPIVDIMIFFFGGLFVFVGAVGLLNTLMMSVIERRKEIGIMMALGLNPGNIRNIFLFEGVVFGLVGAVIGVAIGGLVSIPLVTTGISLGADAMDKIDFPMRMTIKGSINATTIILSFSVGVLTTLIGSILPARQASQLEPVDVLRQE